MCRPDEYPPYDARRDACVRTVTCMRWLWREGMDVLCQRNGAVEWIDKFGVEHAACPSHIADMKLRYAPAEPVAV